MYVAGIAGIAGLIGLLGSAFTYIVSEYPSMRKAIDWHDEVRVAEFAANDTRNFTIAAANIGDGSVILVSITIYLATANTSYVVDKVLDPGKLLSETFDVKKDPQGNAPQVFADYDIVIANRLGKPNSVVIQRSQIIYSFDHNTWPCFLKVPINETSPGLRRMEETYSRQGDHLVTEPLRAVANYFSVHSGKMIETPFPAVATFMLSTKPECRALNFHDAP